jgi:pimeloyl-ACP methyl ester carboxylesterase
MPNEQATPTEPAIMRVAESRYFDSGPLRIHYNVWGDERKPPLVLVHGMRDHSRNWDFVAESFSDRFTVYAPDLRGHGDSDWAPTGAYNIADHVADLARLVDEIDRGPVAIVGHSLGGRIVPAYAAAFPDRIVRLASIEGFGGYFGDESPAQRLARYVQELNGVKPREWKTYASLDEATERMQEAHPHIAPALAAHLTRHAVRRLEDGSYVWKFDPCLHVQSVHEWTLEFQKALWASIDKPLLLMGGSSSWARLQARVAALGLGEARTAVIEGAGHWVHHDQPAAFVSAVAGFLSEA